MVISGPGRRDALVEAVERCWLDRAAARRAEPRTEGGARTHQEVVEGDDRLR